MGDSIWLTFFNKKCLTQEIFSVMRQTTPVRHLSLFVWLVIICSSAGQSLIKSVRTEMSLRFRNDSSEKKPSDNRYVTSYCSFVFPLPFFPPNCSPAQHHCFRTGGSNISHPSENEEQAIIVINKREARSQREPDGLFFGFFQCTRFTTRSRLTVHVYDPPCRSGTVVF